MLPKLEISRHLPAVSLLFPIRFVVQYVPRIPPRIDHAQNQTRIETSASRTCLLNTTRKRPNHSSSAPSQRGSHQASLPALYALPQEVPLLRLAPRHHLTAQGVLQLQRVWHFRHDVDDRAHDLRCSSLGDRSEERRRRFEEVHHIGKPWRVGVERWREGGSGGGDLRGGAAGDLKWDDKCSQCTVQDELERVQFFLRTSVQLVRPHAATSTSTVDFGSPLSPTVRWPCCESSAAFEMAFFLRPPMRVTAENQLMLHITLVLAIL